MCEEVEKYAKSYADEREVKLVTNLMESMKLSPEQALDALGIQGDSRRKIAEYLQS